MNDPVCISKSRKIVRFTLSILAVSSAIACAPANRDGNPTISNPPSGDGIETRSPQAAAQWKTLSLSEKGDLNLPCPEPTVFTVKTDGSWDYEACRQPQSGKLNEADLKSMTGHLQLIIDGGFEQTCADGRMTGLHLVNLALNDGQEVTLREMTEDTNCHRGVISLVDALDKQILDFRTRYVKH